MRIPSGVTDQYIYFVAVDATDFTTRETGLNAFTVYRSRNGGAAAAFTAPTIDEVDAVNMPGVYRLLLDEDMTIDAGDDSQEMVFHITHAGMAPVTRTIELYRPKLTVGETLTVTSGVGSANAVQISGDATAADNLENAFDDTAGPVPWLGILDQGTAQSATATTVVLRAAATFGDNTLIGATLVVYGSTQGFWQTRAIEDYDLATNTATVAPWDVTPSGTIAYKIFASAPAPSTQAADIRAAVGLASANLDTQLGALPTAAEINAEVVDALSVDTYAEPGQGAPAATASLAAKINYLYKAWRNRKTQTATTLSIYNDAGTTVDQKATVSDDGTTATVGEIVSGP